MQVNGWLIEIDILWFGPSNWRTELLQEIQKYPISTELQFQEKHVQYLWRKYYLKTSFPDLLSKERGSSNQAEKKTGDQILNEKMTFLMLLFIIMLCNSYFKKLFVNTSKYLINSLFHWLAHQSILFASLTPTIQVFFPQKPSSTNLFHAAFHPSKPRSTFFRQAKRMFQCHVSYHSRTALRIFFRQSIKFSPFRASCCATTRLSTFDFCTKHRLLNKWICTFTVDLIVQKLALIVTCI